MSNLKLSESLYISHFESLGFKAKKSRLRRMASGANNSVNRRTTIHSEPIQESVSHLSSDERTDRFFNTSESKRRRGTRKNKR